jgi:hypothetical protein
VKKHRLNRSFSCFSENLLNSGDSGDNVVPTENQKNNFQKTKKTSLHLFAQIFENKKN